MKGSCCKGRSGQVCAASWLLLKVFQSACPLSSTVKGEKGHAARLDLCKAQQSSQDTFQLVCQGQT